MGLSLTDAQLERINEACPALYNALLGTELKNIQTDVDTVEAGEVTDAILLPVKSAVVADKTPGNTFVIPVAVADGAGDTVVYNANAPYKFRVIDAVVVKTSANGGAGDTVKVVGAGDITDAIDLNINDKITARAGSIDDAQHEIAAAGSLKITAAHNTDNACIVYIHCMRVA